LKIAEMRRKGAEDAPKRIKEEDEADAKKEKAALAEEMNIKRNLRLSQSLLNRKN
jgi:hypothetical protein